MRILPGTVIVALALWGHAGPAAGHAQFSLGTVNRYTRLALLPHGQVRILYTLMVGDVPAMELRQKADSNHDGRVDAAEAAALARMLRDQVLAGMDVQIDDRPVRPFDGAEPALVLGAEAVAPTAFSMELSAMVPVPSGAGHHLRYDDRAALPPIGEVEVQIEPGPGVALLESRQGAPRPDLPAQKQTRFLFYGAPPSSLADRSVTIAFREGGRRGRYAACWPLAPLPVLGGPALWVWLRRRRRASGR